MPKKSEMIGFKTTPQIRQKLEAVAKEEDRSISYIINRIISEYFAQHPNAETDADGSESTED